MALKRSLGLSVVVEAIEAESLAGEDILGLGVTLGELATSIVASDHLESSGESLDVVAIEEIVGEHTADLLDHLSGSIGMLEMNRWGPVSRLILHDAAGGAMTVVEVVVGGRLAESARSMDDVGMLAGPTEVDQRINATIVDTTAARHTPEGRSWDGSRSHHEGGRNLGERWSHLDADAQKADDTELTELMESRWYKKLQ